MFNDARGHVEGAPPVRAVEGGPTTEGLGNTMHRRGGTRYVVAGGVTPNAWATHVGTEKAGFRSATNAL